MYPSSLLAYRVSGTPEAHIDAAWPPAWPAGVLAPSAPGFRPVHRSTSRRQAIALQSQPLRIAHLGILWGFSDETTNDELTA
jgi:hypothetical protein